MTNEEIFEEFGFIVQDPDFKKQMHLVTKPFLGKWIEVFGKPEEHEDEAEYYLRLSFGLVGYQIQQRLTQESHTSDT